MPRLTLLYVTFPRYNVSDGHADYEDEGEGEGEGVNNHVESVQ